MNAHTRISGKGQVVVPKATRDRLGWVPGTDLEIFETSDTVTLRRRDAGGRLSMDEAIKRLRAIYRHDGAPVPLEQLNWSDDTEDADD